MWTLHGPDHSFVAGHVPRIVIWDGRRLRLEAPEGGREPRVGVTAEPLPFAPEQDLGEALEALRLLDIAAVAESEAVLRTRLAALEILLREAREGLNNYSEVGFLRADLEATRAKLQEGSGDPDG